MNRASDEPVSIFSPFAAREGFRFDNDQLVEGHILEEPSLSIDPTA